MGRHPALVPVAHLTLLRYCSMRPLGRLLPPRREGEEVAGGTPPGPRQGSAPAPPRRTGSEPPAGECPCTPEEDGERAPGRGVPLHPRGRGEGAGPRQEGAPAPPGRGRGAGPQPPGRGVLLHRRRDDREAAQSSAPPGPMLAPASARRCPRILCRPPPGIPATRRAG